MKPSPKIYQREWQPRSRSKPLSARSNTKLIARARRSCRTQCSPILPTYYTIILHTHHLIRVGQPPCRRVDLRTLGQSARLWNPFIFRTGSLDDPRPTVRRLFRLHAHAHLGVFRVHRRPLVYHLDAVVVIATARHRTIMSPSREL